MNSLILIILFKSYQLLSSQKSGVISYIAQNTSTNVTTLEGDTTYLNCKILNALRSSQPVSWIRLKDEHILTVGSYRFTRNPRFNVYPDTKNGNWPLQILYTNVNDTGWYECQISSFPYKKSLRFHLKVKRKLHTPVVMKSEIKSTDRRSSKLLSSYAHKVSTNIWSVVAIPALVLGLCSKVLFIKR